jgi:hypothetical protein
MKLSIISTTLLAISQAAPNYVAPATEEYPSEYADAETDVLPDTTSYDEPTYGETEVEATETSAYAPVEGVGFIEVNPQFSELGPDLIFKGDEVCVPKLCEIKGYQGYNGGGGDPGSGFENETLVSNETETYAPYSMGQEANLQGSEASVSSTLMAVVAGIAILFF